MVRHRMTDEKWNLIEDVFPPAAETGRPPRDRREILDGIFWILRTGSPWRDLPGEFGPWKTVYNLFNTWNSDGTLDEIRHRLQGACIEAGEIDSELWCVDGTNVRAARCAAGGGKQGDPDEPDDHALGRSRGGFSTKLHLLCDSKGHPLHFELSPGQAHENTTLMALLEGADETLLDQAGQPIAWPAALAGDKGYRANWIDETLLAMDITPVIPSREGENRDARPVEFDKELYRQRNIIERLIGWLKECRRILSRFEKTAINFAGMIKMAIIERYLKLAT